MRILYNLLIYLLQIPIAAYWLLRSIAKRSYRSKIGQRLGFGYPELDSCIWIHAVSVGEVQAAGEESPDTTGTGEKQAEGEQEEGGEDTEDSKGGGSDG